DRIVRSGSAPPRPKAKAYHAAQVVDRGAEDVDARVGIVGPRDGHLVQPQAGALREDKQLGVEEPRLVLDARHDLPRHLAAHGLEAALRVGKARAEGEAQHEVVRARDEFASDSAAGVRAARETAADPDVALAGEDRKSTRLNSSHDQISYAVFCL